jgi:ADP-heptose:LPS heptosyltransferase
MGDVALVTPVLQEMKKHFPEGEVILLTRSAFKPFFSQSDQLFIFSPDFKKRHKGIPGLIRLYFDLIKDGKLDYVIDIHDVLRSKILRFLFRLGGTPVSVIDKGRREKRDLITGKSKVQLKHTVERYCDAFRIAGFELSPSEKQNIFPDPGSLKKIDGKFKISSSLKIGVAPYAKHKLKMWPEEYMVKLMTMISEKHNTTFFLFGGTEDAQQLNNVNKKIPDSVNLAGKISLSEELAIMSRLDFMIAMDSSNMHMASLVGTRVISVWGGTDPLNGFGAWKQPDEYSLRIPVTELTCRPCTIFGKGECKRGDFACMNWLTPETIFQKLISLKII